MIGNNTDLYFEIPEGYSDENPNEWAIPYLMERHKATEEDAEIYLKFLNFDPNNEDGVVLYAYLRFMTTHNFFYSLNIAKSLIETKQRLMDSNVEFRLLRQELKRKNNINQLILLPNE